MTVINFYLPESDPYHNTFHNPHLNTCRHSSQVSTYFQHEYSFLTDKLLRLGLKFPKKEKKEAATEEEKPAEEKEESPAEEAAPAAEPAPAEEVFYLSLLLYVFICLKVCVMLSFF